MTSDPTDFGLHRPLASNRIVLDELYRDVEILRWNDNEERDFPYYISGEWWLSERENTYDAEESIVAEARRRGASVMPESELGLFFLYAADGFSARVLVDVLFNQGRLG